MPRRRRGAPAPAPAAPAAPVAPAAPALDAQAVAFVDDMLRENAVVMFALEWCEFCWAARKLFARLGVADRSVDIDSLALQQGDLGIGAELVAQSAEACVAA